eukprot:TRINITY_DN27665_c0_g1_i1.p1 TRINITY_DN27665_c0_g1~~TRINITY_DN27665_c0_g1_i1.p1  ORF type:complete len:215 (+),score=36.25 TRINITY_DN27665_c0_g1_i1:176-820(+)
MESEKDCEHVQDGRTIATARAPRGRWSRASGAAACGRDAVCESKGSSEHADIRDTASQGGVASSQAVPTRRGSSTADARAASSEAVAAVCGESTASVPRDSSLRAEDDKHAASASRRGRWQRALGDPAVEALDAAEAPGVARAVSDLHGDEYMSHAFDGFEGCHNSDNDDVESEASQDESAANVELRLHQQMMGRRQIEPHVSTRSRGRLNYNR